jgi:outer membrane biosynthesis protein TonB
VPDRRSTFRLLALAGFLLTVALALWLAEVRPLLVIIVMALALGVAWSVEWLSRRREDSGEEGSVRSPEGPAEPEPEPVVEAPAAPVALLEPPAPEAEPVPELLAEPPPPAPPALEQEPAQPRPPLRPVPSPPPEPAPPPPLEPVAEPVRPAASSEVVDLRMRATAQPRRWNLWDLERRARDEAARDPVRYEEWSYLFVHLRQFATPDGSLPTEFDGLVRESFGELLERAG